MSRLMLFAVSTCLLAAGSVRGDDVRKLDYKKTPQGELAIHVHFPPEWKATDKRPAIVFFFGGGWRKGRVTQFEEQAKYLASRGMVAARADYRVKSRHKTGPDKCVEDCKSAVRYLRKNAERLGIDPDRIVASGGSAGGHTAAATAIIKGFEAKSDDATVSSKPNLLVLFNPALNTANIPTHVDPKLGKQISPVHHIAKDTPAAIMFFGTNDRLISGANEYVERAKKLGLEAQLFTAADQKHGFFNRSPWRESTLLLTDRFLVKHGYLKGKSTIQASPKARLSLAASSKK